MVPGPFPAPRRDQWGHVIYEGQPWLPAPPAAPAAAAPVEQNPFFVHTNAAREAAQAAAAAMNADGLWGNWQPGHGRDPRAAQPGDGKGKGKGKFKGPRHQVRAGQDPTRFQLPRWCQRLIGQEAAAEDAASALCVDTRDRRIISPWQGHFALEINDNADSALNVVTERAQMQSSSSGYLFQFFAIYTLQHYKLVLMASMDSATAVHCGAWDADSARALGSQHFQPFDWPNMIDSSPTNVDLKMKLNGEVLGHWVFRGYGSDENMSVVKAEISDGVVEAMDSDSSQFSFTISVFQGVRVICVTFEPGQRLYALTRYGSVVGLEQPRMHVEVRRVFKNSQTEAFGQDGDRIEMRFKDMHSRLTVGTHKISVPPSWIVVGHVSGPANAALVRTARDHGCRVEAPDQSMQFSELTELHATWYQGSTADVGAVRAPTPVLVNKNVLGDQRAQFHTMVDAQLIYMPMIQVATEALAVGAHAEALEVPIVFTAPLPGVGVQIMPAMGARAIGMGMMGQNEMAMGGIEARPVQAAVEAVAAPDLQARRDQAARRNQAEARGFNALDLRPPQAVFELPIADQNMRHEAHNAFDHLGNQARMEALRRDLGPGGRPVLPWEDPNIPGFQRAEVRAVREGQGPVIQEVRDLIDLQVQGPEIAHGREPPGLRAQEIPEPAAEPVVLQPWDPEGRRRVTFEE